MRKSKCARAHTMILIHRCHTSKCAAPASRSAAARSKEFSARKISCRQRNMDRVEVQGSYERADHCYQSCVGRLPADRSSGPCLHTRGCVDLWRNRPAHVTYQPMARRETPAATAQSNHRFAAAVPLERSCGSSQQWRQTSVRGAYTSTLPRLWFPACHLTLLILILWLTKRPHRVFAVL